MNQIDGGRLKEMFISAANNLGNHRNGIDDLNVFPVPDGDTGKNMFMTISAAATALASLETCDIDSVATAVSGASLRGARGNSGVILSQVFRGLSAGMKGNEYLTTELFAAAMMKGSETAYKAVMRPTEGTILTVVRETAEFAVEVCIDESNFIKFFEKVLVKANESLENTPNLLPVLKEAGVVDAGGKGFVVILEGMLASLNGKDVVSKEGGEPAVVVTQRESSTDIEFTYCTEFLINKSQKNLSITNFNNLIAGLGDSNLVIDDEEVVKVHVHTNNPGKALEYGLKLGELCSIKIDNMKIQHTETIREPEEVGPLQDPVEYGMVAVATGDGLAQIFKDLSVDVVVNGGQSMNPSTEDILRACNKINAKTIFVFPNNKNVILAAEQVNELSRSQVVVIPTKDIPQGFGAILAMMESEELDAKKALASEAITNVTTGQVTFAARDSEIGGKKIKKGDILGMVGDEICVVGKKVDKVVRQVADLVAENAVNGVLNLFYGSDVKEADANKLAEVMQKNYKSCDVLVHRGGQPLYYYIISAE